MKETTARESMMRFKLTFCYLHPAYHKNRVLGQLRLPLSSQGPFESLIASGLLFISNGYTHTHTDYRNVNAKVFSVQLLARRLLDQSVRSRVPVLTKERKTYLENGKQRLQNHCSRQVNMWRLQLDGGEGTYIQTTTSWTMAAVE